GAAVGEVRGRGLADDPSVGPPDALSWLAEVGAAIGRLGPRAEPPPRPPRPGRDPIAPLGWSWHVRQSAWVLASLAIGLLTWVGFLYIGLVAKRRRGLVASAVYALLAGGGGGLAVGPAPGGGGEPTAGS